MQRTVATARGSDSFTMSCTIAYGMLGWVLSGLGAVLPELRDEIGSEASIYPLMPGAALLAIGLAALARHRAPTRPHHAAVWQGCIVLAGALVALSVTDVRALSLLGAAVVGLSAAGLIRVLPAALTSHHADRAGAAVTRANAWSSLASITGPLTVGAAAAIGLGWRTGFVVVPAFAAAVVVHLARSSPDDDGPDVDGERVDAGVRQEAPNRWIEAWLVLTLSIVIEFAFTYFASTYLHEEVGMTKAAAATGAAAFAIGMAGGRFLAGPFRRLGELGLRSYVATIGVGFALLWAWPSAGTAVVGIGVAGLGVAMLYPIGIGRLLRCFPDDPDTGASRGALASGTALLASPALLASLRELTDVRTAYLCVPVLLVVVLLADRRATRLGSRATAAA